MPRWSNFDLLVLKLRINEWRAKENPFSFALPSESNFGVAKVFYIKNAKYLLFKYLAITLSFEGTQSRGRTGTGCPTGVWDQRVYRFRHLGLKRVQSYEFFVKHQNFTLLFFLSFECEQPICQFKLSFEPCVRLFKQFFQCLLVNFLWIIGDEFLRRHAEELMEAVAEIRMWRESDRVSHFRNIDFVVDQ